MQIWAESGKSALPICNYSQILYQFLTFTQNLKRSRIVALFYILSTPCRYIVLSKKCLRQTEYMFCGTAFGEYLGMIYDFY